MRRICVIVALFGFAVAATPANRPVQGKPADDVRPALAGGRFSAAAATVTHSNNSSAPAAAKKTAERQREGTRISDEIGTFQFVGDRVAFLPSGNKDSYRVLENLALERISQALGESRGQRMWVVSGTLTEFRGANYLLVSKAIIQLQDKEAGGR